MSRYIFLIITLFIAFSTWADDEPKQVKKKNQELKYETKNTLKIVSKRSDGDDTLVFDKTNEDTLIFADDEKRMQGMNKPNANSKSDFTVLNKKEKAAPINPVIYPNPFIEQAWLILNAEENSTTTIIITSSDGKLIRSESFIGKKYELKDLATGAYIITILYEAQTVKQRLFVK